MPSFPIIDTHLHLWDPTVLRYPWLDPIPLLNRSFLLEDYQLATAGINIDKMVFVQCECEFSQCEKEVEWVTEQANLDKRITGIVAWAPLEKGVDSAQVLERYSENKLVKGIRRIIQFEPDAEFCLKEEFIRGVQLLSHYNYTFDICVAYYQLNKVIQLVQACPQTLFVLDHIGKPNIKNHSIEPWRSNIKELSKLDNVYCKLSGLVTEADHENWKQEDLVDYIQTVLDCFTPDRLLFGGDWPVAIQASDYKKWIETLDWALTNLPQDDLIKIYRNNADRIYRIA